MNRTRTTTPRDGLQPPRPTVKEFLDEKRSMLGNASFPREYGAIETTGDALAAAVPPAKSITLRMHIVWDNEVDNLDLPRVLDTMRETGAAMVVKVEQVTD